ncbi:hypothetical protein ACFY0A_44885, partial [Streptomyces sp. NPDC001698]|uniref:hypothetical protein n=1 Tax=unclassified Streptomyces TaxID=2593676 RepID=UPI0036A6E043
GADIIKPSRKPVTSGDTFSRTSHDRNYSCGVSRHSACRLHGKRARTFLRESFVDEFGSHSGSVHVIDTGEF